MKRVRGVEEIGQTISSIPKQQQQQQHVVTVTAGVALSSSSSSAATNSGHNVPSDAIAASKTSVEYHPGPGTSTTATSLTVVSTSGAVRTVQTKDMPSSIQYSQTQQQYPGAIVVPAATPSPVKGYLLQPTTTSLSANSSCGASSLATGVTLHSGGGLAPSGNHTLGPQTQVTCSQATVGHPLQSQQQQTGTIRHKLVQAPTPPASTVTNSSQFQRLKVEDALSYLDQVKFKFSDQPQVYNDFLDIMKEFKSQSIDTPGVITRVSHLFKGHPELIVGFNTFLPPGYKIEVQANEQGYAFQVSVSMPSPTSTHTSTLSQHHCTVNVGSPPIASTSIQTSKAQPVMQILPGSGNVHPNINNTNNIPNNNSNNSSTSTSTNIPIHDSASPPASSSYNSHVTQAQAQAVSQALSQAQEGVPTSGQTQQNQPVEFNHAINYVNKIKNRFQSHPDKYKRFLEILHTYQKEQRTLKGSGQLGSNSANALASSGKHLTEAEVYSQVAKLFENQEDLLLEFGQFLPDATNQQSALSAMFQSNKVGAVNDHASIAKKPIGYKPQYNNTGTTPRDQSGPIGTIESREKERDRERVALRDFNVTGQKFGHSQGQLKRSPSFAPQIANTGNSHTVHGPPPPKKHKVASAKDASFAEVAKHGTLQDYAFFDKVRKALRSQEVYDNFLRCLVLFNQEIVSKSELLQLVSPFLGRFPELLRWFKEFLGHLPEPAPSTPTSTTPSNNQNINPNTTSYGLSIEVIPNNVVRNQENRPQGDLAMEIDYSTCKRLGASYCALPKSYIQPKCSGRTQLCKEVLNDTWVSFPTWSEDSTFVTSRKTQFEECIYRCEDERFELDGVIETNAATIRVLEGVQKKMNRMTQEELHKFKLDECLGGSSPTIHQRALKRIYGDKAADIIDGLKKNPLVAVPVVLRRLKAKEEEWREAQKGFNKLWREQNEKFYLKSLDHQGINFKQNDLKFLRSKSLYNEIEILYDERHEAEESSDAPSSSAPHMVLSYKDKSVLDDAVNLLIHHVKRQTSIHKEDKQQIKQLLKHVIPDMFFHPRQELSDDEQDDENDKDDANSETCGNGTQGSSCATPTGTGSGAPQANNRSKSSPSPAPSSINAKANVDSNVKSVNEVKTDPDEAYTLFFGSNNWYLFLRLHHLLCERLTKMYERAMVLAEEEAKYKQQRKESTAIALRLKPKTDVEIEDYYPAFLDMVKNLLDGNMDFNTYEDTLREMFGIHAYIAFTLDKVVSYAVRQLQHLVTDPSCQQCLELFQREQKQPRETCGSGGLCHTAFLRTSYEQNYQRKAEKMLSEENCFKIYIYKKKCTMTIELMDTENEENADNSSRGDRSDRESSVAATEKWSNYVERYTVSTSSVTNVLTTTNTSTSANVNVQASSKDVTVTTMASDNEPSGVTLSTISGASASSATSSHPVSSDQAAKGGRGRKRKNIVDVNKKMDGSSWNNSLEKVLAGRKRVYLYRNVNQYRKLAARKARLSSPFDTVNPSERSVSESKDATRDDGCSNIIASDETQCTFSLNNYRVIYVVNQETTLYKKGSFTKAKQRHKEITSKKYKQFFKWYSQWSNKHLSDSQQRQSADWMMGRTENLVNHKIRVLNDNDLNTTPYRVYNRYRIEIQPSTDSKE